MAIDATELETMRDALIRARLHGLRTVEYADRSTTYKNDAEMASALAWVERQLQQPRINQVKFTASKGLTS